MEFSSKILVFYRSAEAVAFLSDLTFAEIFANRTGIGTSDNI